MINNEMNNQLNRFFNNRNSQAGGGANIGDMLKRLKDRQASIHGKKTSEEEAAAKAPAEEQADKSEKATKQNQLQRYYNRKNGASKSDADDSKKTAAAEEEEELTPMQRREKELKAIMAKLDAEEAARNAARFGSRDKKNEAAKTDEAANQDGVATTSNDPKDLSGVQGFLNDMPLFDEFKTGLMNAFEMLDKAAVGSINAQYELNYTSMQYIANAAGGYDYQETTVNVKLDLNYIKAAAGGQTGKELSKAIADSTDFASLVENLQKAGQSQQSQQAANVTPQDFLTSMQDYFSPEKTAGRIVDFATAFFPMSDAFKKGGDTEESRTEFAEMMRKAIQKGFDQAQGILGKVPKETQDGINKTHELTMQGIDDFIKNGLNKGKQDQGVYSSLEQFAMNFEVSYSHKSVSVRNGTYNNAGVTTSQGNPQQTGAVDTEA